MSILGLTKLTWDLEHQPGLLDRYRQDSESVLSGYQLTDAERAAVRELNAHALLDVGLNPVVLRNLFVTLGVPHGQMYAAGEDGAGAAGSSDRQRSAAGGR